MYNPYNWEIIPKEDKTDELITELMLIKHDMLILKLKYHEKEIEFNRIIDELKENRNIYI